MPRYQRRGSPTRGPAREDRDRDRGRSGERRSSSRVRVTGLWETRRRGLYTGGLTQDQEDALAGLRDLCAAVLDGKEERLSFFMFENEGRRGPMFTIYADVGKAYRSSRGGQSTGRRIEEPDDDDEHEEIDF